MKENANSVVKSQHTINKDEGLTQIPERKVSCENINCRPTTIMDRRKSLQIIPHQLVLATIIANEKLDKRRKSCFQTLPISIKGVYRINIIEKKSNLITMLIVLVLI